MRKLIFVGLIAIASLAQDRESPPPMGTPKPFAVPESETFTLKNGMKVTLAQHGQIPLVSVGVDLACGKGFEAADQVWLSSLMLQMIKEGTERLSAAEVASEAARMGGQLDVGIGTDASTVELDVLSEFAPDAVKLISDVLRHPRFPESELERVRNNGLRQLAVQLATPQAQANQAFVAKLFPDHAYGRAYPSESHFKSYTIADVRKFYADFIGAQRTNLYVVGKFDASAVRKTIESAFDGWPAGTPVKRTPPVPSPKGELVLLDRPDAPQSTLRIGTSVSVHAGDKDFFPIQVANNLLGGAFISRITNNIREQKGYTYSPVSVLTNRFHTAYWQEAADVTTKFTGESIHEIVFEIDRLRKEPPSQQELKGIQNYMGGIFVLNNTSNQGIIGQLSFVQLHGLTPDYLKTYIQKVNAVTRQDVQRIAEQYWNPAKMTYVVVGDKSKIADAVKTYPPQ